MKIQYYLSRAMTVLLFSYCFQLLAQPVLETGKGKMPDQWVDSKTGYLIKRLVNEPGNHSSFYFHNNPFVDGKMVFYGSDLLKRDTSIAADGYVFHPKGNPYNRQIFTYDLSSGKVTQLTHKENNMNGEIVSQVNHEAYYQIKDSIFGVNIQTGKERLIFVFPEDFKAGITTVNADGTLLGGAYATPEEAEISRKYPKKHDYFNRIYESKLPRTLFTINIQTKKLEKIFTDSAWLNHVQFSPTDPHLMMFCHEGPWEKVDRIWTIDVVKKAVPKLIHKRTMYREIAGHEWFSSDGKYIWYDLQLPRGDDFYIGGTELATGKEIKYHLKRNEWSVHFVSAQTKFINCILSGSNISRSNLKNSVLKDSNIFGISAWDVSTEDSVQENLTITNHNDDSIITVDDLEIANFIYLVSNNDKISSAIDTITSKIVLILGRFTKDRLDILKHIKIILKQNGLVPVLFDFDKPKYKDLTETIGLIGRMSRFIVPDLTAAKSIPQELSELISNNPSIKFYPVLDNTEREYSMFEHWERYPWVEKIFKYKDKADLTDYLNKILDV